jgi:hypothetical protein|tara:strand:+ start:202 stop:441 length:240 start_codon:yes stop_codon:yes gene_type:complete
MKKETLNLNNIVHDCELEFWDELIKHMPLADSGDFDPWQAYLFQKAMEDAIKHWWHFNGSEHYNLKVGKEILVRRGDES